MGKVENFRDLNVWQRGMDVVEAVYRASGVSQNGAVRANEPDSASGRIRAVEYRRRTYEGHHPGIFTARGNRTSVVGRGRNAIGNCRTASIRREARLQKHSARGAISSSSALCSSGCLGKKNMSER